MTDGQKLLVLAKLLEIRMVAGLDKNMISDLKRIAKKLSNLENKYG